MLTPPSRSYHMALPLAAKSHGGAGPAGVSPAISDSLSPAQIRGAYGISQLPAADNGAGQTIAIVNASTIRRWSAARSSDFSASDLHVFDANYGLADPPSFLKLDENGGTNYPTGNSGWERRNRWTWNGRIPSPRKPISFCSRRPAIQTPI